MLLQATESNDEHFVNDHVEHSCLLSAYKSCCNLTKTASLYYILIFNKIVMSLCIVCNNNSVFGMELVRVLWLLLFGSLFVHLVSCFTFNITDTICHNNRNNPNTASIKPYAHVIYDKTSHNNQNITLVSQSKSNTKTITTIINYLQ